MKSRQYQKDAISAILTELQENNNQKCIVKMFCGSGKSHVMQQIAILLDTALTVFVFPSLALIGQFAQTYMSSVAHLLTISSDEESTTDPREIQKFLEDHTQEKKTICITYQSFTTLLENLGENVIRLCCYDEAHHAVGETYRQFIFQQDKIDKQVFFTATPKNANGIVMYDRDNPESGMCGNLCYDYSYLRGVEEGYLNPFDLRVDLALLDTNVCKYESIARAILQTGNSRVLTFHGAVHKGETSVKSFVDQDLFREAFHRIADAEFPQKKNQYANIHMMGMDANTAAKTRKQILALFKKRKRNDEDDDNVDNTVIVLSTCETVGEGVDTFNANMCVFIDPKTSHVKIIQNIGRVVRKVPGVDTVPSTVLLCCYVEKEKYLACDGDQELIDDAIREDMGKSGNFNTIMNTMTALQQEDPDIYDMCLNYAENFTSREIEYNLKKQKYVTVLSFFFWSNE